MMLQFFSACGVLALLTVVPGPDMAVVTKRAVMSGWGDGERTAAGITAGLVIWGVLTVVGLSALVAASATVYTVVKLAGAGYLVILGVQALLRRHHGDHAVDPVSGRRSAGGSPWRTGLIANLMNPKIAIFYTGLLPTLAPKSLPPAVGMALLVGVHAVLTFGWLSGYVFLLSRARGYFEKPVVRRAMDRITGVVLIGFGIKVATSSA